MATLALAEVRRDLADQIDAIAARQQRPKLEIVEEALSDWLRLENHRHARTLRGLADIDAGRVVDHERVVAWVESLATDNPLPRPRALP